jgi:hypothetical protein
VEKIQKPYFVSQTVMPLLALSGAIPGTRPRWRHCPPRLPRARPRGGRRRRGKVRVRPLGGLHPLKPLIREWLLELKVMGRSPRPFAQLVGGCIAIATARFLRPHAPITR